MPSKGPFYPRRVPDSVHRRVEVATAMAWESLVDAHTAHALDFMVLLAGRLEMQDALNRYVREVGVIEPMSTAVRTRVLVALEDEESAGRRVQLHEAEVAATEAAHEAAAEQEAERRVEEEGERWRRLTPRALVSGVRERQRSRDETERLVLLAMARAEEDVIGTHVDHAITFAALLEPFMGLDRAVKEYIHVVGLGGPRAQAVFQRTMARLADVHLPRPRPAREIVRSRRQG